MYLEETADQQALRKELREYFAKLVTPEVIEKTHGGEGGEEYRRVIRQMGKDGWLAIGWPKEYGGQGRGDREQLIFFEEAQRVRTPMSFVTINTVAPALMAHGSEQQKQEFLPKIAAGEINFAIGYTEPGAGTDLASLKTEALKDGDDWVINGTKVFTSGAEGADYVWLAARTDKEAPKHKGITMFIVPTKDPGFTLAPIFTVGDIRTNMTYYDNIRIPNSAVVGTVNKGWQLITSQLNHERVGLAALGIWVTDHVQKVLNFCRHENENGARLIDIPWVQSNMAQCFSLIHAQNMMNARMTWSLEQKKLDPAFASGMKVYSSEAGIEIYRLLLDVLGAAALVRRQSQIAVLKGEIEEGYRKAQTNTFGGGVNEVQREIVAGFGLRMQRAAR